MIQKSHQYPEQHTLLLYQKMEPHAHSFKVGFFFPLAPENPPMKQTVPGNCSLTLHELAVLVCLCTANRVPALARVSCLAPMFP